MDKKLKVKWAKALRSGRYKQGRYLLGNERDGTNCCLGVLCRVAKRLVSYSTIERLMTGEDQSKFIIMNDNREEPFEKIADYIDGRKAISGRAAHD